MKTILTGLKTGIHSEIEINITPKISSKINAFKKAWENNSHIIDESKFRSMINSESFSSMYTEGEISSRRLIKSVDKSDSNGNNVRMIKNFMQAYSFVIGNSEISMSSLFTLYSNLTSGLELGDNKLKDGQMHRDDDVYIAGNKLEGAYMGIDPKKLPKAFSELISFIHMDGVDTIIKSIVAHLYFEIMHPYYDFNGRTGRFIPMWISRTQREPYMDYFATSIGNFREQYLALFGKCIDLRTKKVDTNLFIDGILDLLILNQYQYSYIDRYNNLLQEETGKFLNSNQKHILYYIMIKYEKQNKASSWVKVDKDAIDFIEVNIKQPQLFREINGLVDAGFLEKTATKPIRYKLREYKLYKK